MGLPIATATWPGWSAEESPARAIGRSSAPGSICTIGEVRERVDAVGGGRELAPVEQPHGERLRAAHDVARREHQPAARVAEDDARARRPLPGGRTGPWPRGPRGAADSVIVTTAGLTRSTAAMMSDCSTVTVCCVLSAVRTGPSEPAAPPGCARYPPAPEDAHREHGAHDARDWSPPRPCSRGRGRGRGAARRRGRGRTAERSWDPCPQPCPTPPSRAVCHVGSYQVGVPAGGVGRAAAGRA